LGLLEHGDDLAVGKAGLLHGTSSGKGTRKFHFWRLLMGGGITVARGIGRWLAPLDGGSDGTVGLAETRLPGLRDHCVVQASHSGLLRSPEAAAQALAFLRTGRFQR
ncbi:hypothetical protein P2C71_15285, partial [Xanthomonas perforans]